VSKVPAAGTGIGTSGDTLDAALDEAAEGGDIMDIDIDMDGEGDGEIMPGAGMGMGVGTGTELLDADDDELGEFGPASALGSHGRVSFGAGLRLQLHLPSNIEGALQAAWSGGGIGGIGSGDHLSNGLGGDASSSLPGLIEVSARLKTAQGSVRHGGLGRGRKHRETFCPSLLGVGLGSLLPAVGEVDEGAAVAKAGSVGGRSVGGGRLSRGSTASSAASTPLQARSQAGTPTPARGSSSYSAAKRSAMSGGRRTSPRLLLPVTPGNDHGIAAQGAEADELRARLADALQSLEAAERRAREAEGAADAAGRQLQASSEEQQCLRSEAEAADGASQQLGEAEAARAELARRLAEAEEELRGARAEAQAKEGEA